MNPRSPSFSPVRTSAIAARRGRGLWLLIGIVFTAAAMGCDEIGQMEDRGRITPQESSPFFADGQSARPIPDGTVARGHARTDRHLFTGQVNGKPAETFPFPISRADLERGRGRYEIYCAPCHGATGDGDGMIVRRGFVPPPSYHIDRLRTAPPGHIFDVITNGYGAMYSHNDRVAPEDRWRIAAYIRVLQLSRRAELASLPPELAREANAATTRPAAPSTGEVSR